MHSVTSQYLRAIANPVKRVAEVTVRLPGESEGTPVDISAEDCTVSMDGGNNARYSASLTLTPRQQDRDAFVRAAAPGAEFTVRAGVDYGRSRVEWVPCGVLYAATGNQGITAGDFPLQLQDGTLPLSETDFLAPWSAAESDRADNSEAIISDAFPLTVVRKLASPSQMAGVVFERDRVEALDTIAKGASQDSAFNASGEWLIQDNPILTPTSPAWVAKSGSQGTILPGAERDIPLSRLYNMVVVLAPESFQTWGAITYAISDPDHPRHYSKIGKRPYFVSDPTIISLEQAVARAQSTLKQLLTVSEQIRIPTLGNVALEYGDTVAVAHGSTSTDPGFGANYLVTGWQFNLGTGAQDITGRSTVQPAIEEA